jgi:diguanylate cyclase
VLRFLHERTDFDLWMVTRTEGNDWIVLGAHDCGYGIQAGKVFRWADSLCSRMVADKGPRVAPDCKVVSAYADAPIATQLPIRAYVGVPLSRADGTLFGTLCGVHSEPKDEALHHELPFVELLAKLLSSLLIAELAAHEQARRAERAEAELLTDALTGLFNRRGWNSLLAAEESRCKRYGNPACVLSIDLDELKQVNDTQGHACGDQLLKTAANVLRTATRHQDVIARVGGDEFGVLAVECDTASGQKLKNRLLDALMTAGVKASIGVAPRRASDTLDRAWIEADQLMYSHKRRERMAKP